MTHTHTHRSRVCFAASLKNPPNQILDLKLFYFTSNYIYITYFAVIKMPGAHFGIQFLSSTFKVLKNLQSGAVAAVLVVLRKVMLTCAVLY